MQCVKKLFSQYNIKVLVVKDLDNIFYLTGQRLSNGLLIILEDKKYFLSDARYIQRLKKLKDWQIIDIAQIKDIYKFLSDVVGEDRFAIEGSSWKVLEYKRLVSRFSEEKIVLLKDDFLKCRQVKTLSEIQKIKQAIYIIEQVWSYIYTNFSQFVGKSELDIRRKIIDLIFEFGGEGESFESIVAFGQATAIPHWQTSKENILALGQPVLIDMGAIYQGYCSDFTRSFWFGQNPDRQWQKVFDAVRKAHDEVWNLAKPGIKISDLDKKARQVLAEYGLEKYFTHALGHGIGIAVHEYPIISSKNEEKITPGMVFTIEPGVYIPGKFGVRWENIKIIE